MTATAWDAGLHWRTEIVERDPAFVAVATSFVADHVIRGVDEVGLVAVTFAIRAATALGERWSGIHIEPKTLRLTLSGFPADGGPIAFADGPIRDIESLVYVDGDGLETPYGGSPPSWILVPSGRYARTLLQPAVGEAWPTARAQPNAVVITFTVGYAATADVPVELQQAVAVTAGELYKSPDLSNTDGLTPNVLKLDHFWPRRWANGL